MSNIKNILVHYDSGTNVDGVVNAAMTIMKGYDSSTVTFAYIDDDQAKAKVAQQKLQDVVQSKRLSGDKVKYVVKKGKSYVELINIARQQPTDAIVMRINPKSSGFFTRLNDNNPIQAVVSAPCPVITLASDASLNKVQNILLPIDDSDRTRQKLPVACNIAKHFGATIHLLALCEDKTGENKIKMQNYAEQSKRFIEDKDVKATYEVILGKNICQTVLEYGNKSNVDMVVVTADEETSILFESCYEKVIHKSTIPVMSVQSKDTKVTWAGM